MKFNKRQTWYRYNEHICKIHNKTLLYKNRNTFLFKTFNDFKLYLNLNHREI